MKINFWTFGAIILAILMCAACREAAPSSPPTVETKPPVESTPPARTDGETSPAKLGNWKISLHRTDGFGYSGASRISIGFDGKMTIEDDELPNRPAMKCETRTPEERLRELREIVSAWRMPDAEALSALGAAAPDAAHYELNLQFARSRKVFQIKWFDNTAEALPPPTKNLFDTLVFYHEMGRKQCALEEMDKGRK